jgi:hypothetical protein
VEIFYENCSSLERLTLRYFDILILENGVCSDSLPDFSSLQHLAVHTKGDPSLVIYIYCYRVVSESYMYCDHVHQRFKY